MARPSATRPLRSPGLDTTQGRSQQLVGFASSSSRKNASLCWRLCFLLHHLLFGTAVKAAGFISITPSPGKRPLLGSLLLYGTAEGGIWEVELWKLLCCGWFFFFVCFFNTFSEPFAKAVAQKYQAVLRAKPSTVQGRPHVLLCCAGQQDLLLVGTAAYTLTFGEKNKKESMAMASWEQLVFHQLCTTG